MKFIFIGVEWACGAWVDVIVMFFITRLSYWITWLILLNVACDDVIQIINHVFSKFYIIV